LVQPCHVKPDYTAVTTPIRLALLIESPVWRRTLPPLCRFSRLTQVRLRMERVHNTLQHQSAGLDLAQPVVSLATLDSSLRQKGYRNPNPFSLPVLASSYQHLNNHSPSPCPPHPHAPLSSASSNFSSGRGAVPESRQLPAAAKPPAHRNTACSDTVSTLFLG